MAIFASFLHPVFRASRLQHISDLHSKFALRPHHVSKYGRRNPNRTSKTIHSLFAPGPIRSPERISQ